MVPLTRPQTVTSCAMTLPSICAPSPIRRSEARTSPLIRPKTCAGPLHSMLPTIDIPEPMQERVAAFVVGSRLGEGCSTTACCCCTVVPATSATFAATSFSFSGTLLLNISTLHFSAGIHCGAKAVLSRSPPLHWHSPLPPGRRHGLANPLHSSASRLRTVVFSRQ